MNEDDKIDIDMAIRMVREAAGVPDAIFMSNEDWVSLGHAEQISILRDFDISLMTDFADVELHRKPEGHE